MKRPSGSEHYRAAQALLGSLRTHWNRLPERERTPLGRELKVLHQLQTKLDQRILSIAVFGLVNRGKSTVLNALLGDPRLKTGPLNGVTQTPQVVQWQVIEAGAFTIQLVDTPGLNEVEGEARAQLAWDVAKAADLILFVISGDITQIEYQALLELRTLEKPILLVFNKIDLYPDRDRQAIYTQITSPRLRQLVSPAEIIMVAAAPTPVKARVHWPDGRVTIEWERPDPLIQELRQRIQEILASDGESLIALNVLMRTQHLGDRILQKQLGHQQTRVQTFLWRQIACKGGLIGILPLPWLDLGLSLGLDLIAIWGIPKLYHLPLSRRWQLLLWKQAGINLAVLAGVEWLTSGFATQLESGQGGALWPSLGGVLLQVGVAGWGSLQLAQRSRTALHQSGGWIALSPRQVMHRILDQLQPTSLLSRIRSELTAQLDPRPVGRKPPRQDPQVPQVRKVPLSHKVPPSQKASPSTPARPSRPAKAPSP